MIEQPNKLSRDAVRVMYPIFSRQVGDRLAIGAEQYGDKSFKRPGTELLEEISQELLDVSGWSFILWTRIQGIIQKINEADEDVERRLQTEI